MSVYVKKSSINAFDLAKAEQKQQKKNTPTGLLLTVGKTFIQYT